MNEQFQQYLMDILQKTGEFLGTEIPEVAQQILMFNLWVNLVWALPLLVCIVMLCFTLKWVIKVYEPDSHDMPKGVACLFICIGMLLCTAIMLSRVAIALKIWLAPKLYLLEYAASLVK